MLGPLVARCRRAVVPLPGGDAVHNVALLEAVAAVPGVERVRLSSIEVNHVNDELEKVGHITDSAVDATDKVDSAVRAVSDAVQKPAKAAAGFTALGGPGLTVVLRGLRLHEARDARALLRSRSLWLALPISFESSSRSVFTTQ